MPLWEFLRKRWFYFNRRDCLLCQFDISYFWTSNARYWHFSTIYVGCMIMSWLRWEDRRKLHTLELSAWLFTLFLCSYLKLLYFYMYVCECLPTSQRRDSILHTIESDSLAITDMTRLNHNISDPVLRWTEIGVLQLGIRAVSWIVEMEDF